MQKHKALTYIFSVIAVQLVGIAGTFFTTPAIQGWYATIVKPAFNPPNWIFGPVWTILFLLIGISLGLVLTTPKENPYKTGALITFAVQLTLNLAWSYFFFYLHRPDLAAVEIVVLLAGITVNIYYTYQVRKPAAYLLVPYLLWVSFATVLSITIWRLNS
jgi:translocator protein